MGLARTWCLVALALIASCTNELVSQRDAATSTDAGLDAASAALDGGGDAATQGDAFVIPGEDAFVSGTDDALVVNAPLPRGFACRAATTTVVTLENTGTTTWSGDLGYALAAVDPADPLALGTSSVALAAGETVAPGEMHDFALRLGATGVGAGTHTTSWRMARGASAFGATVEASIEVYPCETVSASSFDLGSVTIVGSPDVRGFTRTSTLTSLEWHVGSWHVDHTLRGTWPPIVIAPDGTTQEATVWIFFHIAGTWYATGGERLRPDQTDKGLSNPSQLGPDWLYDPGRWGVMSGYVPSPGDLVGMMVVAGSTRSDDNVIAMERTGVVLFPFPADDTDTIYPPFTWQE